MDDLVAAFYRETNQFILNLRAFCEKLPGLSSLDETLFTSQNELSMLKRMAGSSPDFPSKFFVHMEPYGAEILSKNETFFLNFGANTKLFDESSQATSLIESAQIVWKSGELDEGSKENIWQYVILLYRLSEHIATHR